MLLLEKQFTVLLFIKYNVGLTDVDYKIFINGPTPTKFYVPCYSQGVREAVFKELEKNKGGKFYRANHFSFCSAFIVCLRR